MIDAEKLIRGEAESFSIRYRSGNAIINQFKDQLDSQLYNYYESIEKLIYLYEVHRNLVEFYELHLEKCAHKDDLMKCGNNVFFIKSIFSVEQKIRRLNPEFDYKIIRPQVNSDLIKKNLVGLNKYPKAGKLFLQALDKLNEGKNERNMLDDLRLTLETLLREILSNSKSLENQYELLGKHLKEKGTSKEIVNMFRVIITNFSTYQNNNVKHGDNVKEEEIDFIVNISLAMINFLISKE